MKKLFFILLLCGCFVNADAQAWIYHPMPESNAVWRVDQGAAFCNQLTSTFQYSTRSDTVIGSFNYNKIYASGVFMICAGGYWDNYYRGAMRNDTLNKKVYFIERDSLNEILLYDFSLNVGDTLYGTMPFGNSPVTSIDSVLVGSNYHKRFFSSTWEIIEGVGSTYGLLEIKFPEFIESMYLICFTHNADTYINNNFGNCVVIDSTMVGINEIYKPPSTIEISPNPATSAFTITSSSKLKEIKLFSVLGECIYQSEISNSKSEIDISSLAKGIYFVEIKTEEGIVRKKVVKQ